MAKGRQWKRKNKERSKREKNWKGFQYIDFFFCFLKKKVNDFLLSTMKIPKKTLKLLLTVGYMILYCAMVTNTNWLWNVSLRSICQRFTTASFNLILGFCAYSRAKKKGKKK